MWKEAHMLKGHKVAIINWKKSITNDFNKNRRKINGIV
jgi:hypothetical protein